MKLMSVLSLDQVYQDIESDLRSVDKLIFDSLSARDKSINSIGQYVISAGGKRIRPLLNLVFAKIFSYKGDNNIKISAAIEFFHTATLLHDDVIDESNMRRGQEAVHKKWTNKYAILVGDFLFSQAFKLMIATNSLEVLTILSKAAATISEGEVKQLNNLHNTNLTEGAYIDVVRSKTAELFAVASETAAVISGQADCLRQAAYEFGINLGIAFQIIDDIFDYTSSDSGKDIGKDFDEGKVTLPIIILLKKCTLEERNFIDGIFRGRRKEVDDFTKLTLCMNKYGVFKDSKQYALNYLNSADHIISEHFKSLDKQGLLQSILIDQIKKIDRF